MRPRAVLTAASLLAVATAASAHLIVDVRMSIQAPQFVTPGQTFVEHVIAEDIGYDPAYGVVATTTVSAGTNVTAINATGWNCSRSSNTITCSAEQIQPGQNNIDLTIVAPSQPSTITTQTKVQSLGSYDPNPANDTATFAVTVYDPAACQNPAPLLDGPADASTAAGAVRLTWSAVAGARQYVVYTTAEGSATAAVATTTDVAATIVTDPGDTEWWVEADFATCPATTSVHRHFTTAQPLARPIAIFAGRTSAATTADGPLATASFRAPYGVALSVDQKHVYVTDEQDSVLRDVSGGSIITLAGSAGVAGSTDGVAPLFRNPHAIAVTALDSYIYTADTGNDEIRYSIPPTSPPAPSFTVAGAPQTPGYVDAETGNSRVNQPAGVAGSERGLVFVADTGNHLIRKLTPVPISGVVGLFTASTVGGIAGRAGSVDGPAVASQFNAPMGVASDAKGFVAYVADTGNHTIRIIANGTVRTIAGEAGVSGSNEGVGSGAHFNAPVALALDDRNNLVVADRDNHAVRRIAPSGLVTTIASQLMTPTGIAVDHAGNVYVADSAAHVVWIIVPAIATAPQRHRAVAH